MDESYRVVYPGNVLQSFRQICTRAKSLGILPAVQGAGQEIHRELETDPLNFGDPAYSLPSTEQVVYVRGVDPLVVYYAVHQSAKIVIVKSIGWLPSSGQQLS